MEQSAQCEVLSAKKKQEKRLRDYRRARRWSQSELARLLGCSQSQVSEWETGATAPSLPTLCRLAMLFEVSLDTMAQAAYRVE